MAIDDEQGLQAVEIDVERETAEPQRLPRRAADFRSRRRVLEMAVADRPIESQHLSGEVGDHHRCRAGVVHVGGVKTHSGPGPALFAEGEDALRPSSMHLPSPLSR